MDDYQFARAKPPIRCLYAALIYIFVLACDLNVSLSVFSSFPIYSNKNRKLATK